MAAINVDDWIPEEYTGAVITRVNQLSAVEALARREPMATDTKHVPRDAGSGVNAVSKSGSYTEDANGGDDVLLTARKIGRVYRIADEDVKDSNLVNVIATKQRAWATSYAKYIDNATLAVTGAESMPTIPFTSLYRSIRSNNSDTGYTADANIVRGAATYANLSATLGLVETGDYWADGDMICIAHPAFRETLRGILDSQNRPIFVEGLAGTPDTIFGHTVRWSLGAKTHPTATDTPTGNPIVVFGNREYMILGIRSGPESAIAGADSGAAFLTDEALVKMRARRGYATGHEKAFAIFEKTS